MKVVIQRSKNASVSVDNKIINQIFPDSISAIINNYSQGVLDMADSLIDAGIITENELM